MKTSVIKPKSGEIKEITIVTMDGNDKKTLVINCRREHWQADAVFISVLTDQEINHLKALLNNPIRVNSDDIYAGDVCLTLGCDGKRIPNKDHCHRHD